MLDRYLSERPNYREISLVLRVPARSTHKRDTFAAPAPRHGTTEWLRVLHSRVIRRKVTNMPAVPAPQRIELTPAVRAILEAGTPNSRLVRDYVRFLQAIMAQDPAGIDNVVTADSRFHELEAIGLPPGPKGFKLFRRQVNAAIPDEHILITAVRFEGDDIIEADLDISATHTGKG